jgi:DNA-binding NarL/FixJ family response regulator
MSHCLLLIDDHALFRSGVSLVLSSALTDAVIVEADSLEQALKIDGVRPDLVLLDVQLQGVSGLEGITLLRKRWPQSKIVMVSAFDMSDTIDESVQRGALSFISKTERPDRLLELVQAALREPRSERVPSQTVSPLRPHLTPRQVEVLDLLSQGLSNKHIGRRLDLSENTVRGHVQAILAALSVSGRAEAAFAARRLGIIR